MLNKNIQSVIIWSLSILFSSLALLKLIYTVIINGLKALQVKKRPLRPSILTDERFGKHQYVVLEKVGLRLHYVENGDASLPLVVLVHGFPQCWFSWRNQLESLSGQFRVVAVDLPGYGDSDKPTQLDSYRLDRLTEDLKQFVLALGVSREKKCALIGHDWGSILCWNLVENNPELFHHHVCINGTNLYTIDRMINTNLFQFFKSWYIFMFQMPFLPEVMLSVNDLNEYAKILRGPNNDIHAFSDDVIDGYKFYYSRKGSFTGPLNYYRRIFQCDIKPPKEKIQVPTLILWGEKDTALSKSIAIKLLPLCETSSLKFVKNGHFLPEYEPEAVTESIQIFLKAS